MHDSKVAVVRLEVCVRGGLLLKAAQEKGEGNVSLSVLSNYVWRFHAGPLSKNPQYSHTNPKTHTYACKQTHTPSLMIQSCDCWLPAMIEPLHSPPQHKSMSITSPEHIRHFPFLLVISMAHRHIPIPHQAHRGASAHKQKSQGMKWILCVRSNTYQYNKSSYTLFCKWFTSSACLHTHIRGIVINYRWPCHHGVRQWLWKWAEAKTHAVWPWTMRVCVYAHAYRVSGSMSVYACILKLIAVTLKAWYF